MANLNNNPFIHDTWLNEENSLMHLLDAISPDEEDEAILVEHSKYFDYLSIKNTLCIQNGKISILSLNCQSINAKFNKLNCFIDYINDHILISVICIQESWGHEEIDMRMFTLHQIIKWLTKIGDLVHMGVLSRMFTRIFLIEN